MGFKLEKTMCKRCKKMRLVLYDGICIVCKNASKPVGNEIRPCRNGIRQGTEIMSRTGLKDENVEYRKL